jgi:hypothetical protein
MPTAPGFADCSLEIRLGTYPRPAFVTFGVNADSPNPADTAATISGGINVAGSLKTVLAVGAKFTGIRVSMGTDGAEDVVGFEALNITGTYANLTAPANCAALIHKRTARGGRRGRGRWFFPWSIADSEVDEAGIVLAARVTAISAACEVFRQHMATAGEPMVVLHSTSAPGVVHPTTAGPPDVITSMNCDSVVGTQRRRLGR